jgi:hypothetical protein
MHGSERSNAAIFGTVVGVVSISTLTGPREFSLAMVERGLTPIGPTFMREPLSRLCRVASGRRRSWNWP